MSLIDSIVEGATAGLVKLLLRPKLYYSRSRERPVRQDKAAIFIINHTSHLDGPLVTTVFRDSKIHNLAAKDRFEQRGFGFFLRHTGCIPIDRNKPDLSWVHESLKQLKNGESVAIFPEGAHGSHRCQLPFNPGAAMLASMATAPIVMVYVDGPVKLFSSKNALIVSEAFRLEEPQNGIDSAYILKQTQMLESKMKMLMEELVAQL